jgi:uncharacterized membrane protein
VPLFPRAIDEAIFYAAIFIWIVPCSLLESILITRDGQGKTKTSADRGSALLLYASVLTSMIVAYAFAVAGAVILPELTFYLGIAMMGTGMFVRGWAVATLRGYYS